MSSSPKETDTFTPPRPNMPKATPDNVRKVQTHMRRNPGAIRNKVLNLAVGGYWRAQAARWMLHTRFKVGGSVWNPIDYVNCSNAMGAVVRTLLLQMKVDTYPVYKPAEPETVAEAVEATVGAEGIDERAKALYRLEPFNEGDTRTSHLDVGFSAAQLGPNTLVLQRNTATTPPTGSDSAAKYPKYFKSLPPGVSPDAVDTYAIAQMFPVDDPSGAILHARKKLLIPGVRSGGKSMRKDITEARDALNRWLELNPEA